MDGRPLPKVASYLTTSFGVRNLDTITTAGAVKHLAAETGQTPIILANVDISISKHGSRHIAVVAHHDCAGNPVPAKAQRDQLARAATLLRDLYPEPEITALWVNEQGIVERVSR